MRVMLAIVLGASVAACSGPPPVAPGTKLAGPPAWAMAREKAVAPIPEGDGDPAIRRDWYAQELQARSQCRDKVRALQLYVRTVREDQT